MSDYFSGRKELFEGLAISKLETEWKKHPVLKFDFSNIKFQKKGDLEQLLEILLREFYLIFKLSLPFVTNTEVRSAAGRADAVVETDDAVYVFEFKLDGSADYSGVL